MHFCATSTRIIEMTYNNKNTLGLYIHVPFCAVKCPYCDFYSVSYSRKNEQEYTDAVIRNLEKYSQLCTDRIIDSIYFGGGTPSLISTENIKKILFSTFKLFNVENSVEISMEANPNTLNKSRLQGFFSAGINRLSIGIQSLDNNELKSLGRKHNSLQALNAVDTAYNTGFKNISCDIMLGICNQTSKSLQNTLNKISEMPIQHISAYMLKIEPDTPFNCNEIIENLPDEDLSADLYIQTVESLEKFGFMQYEISNFSKKDFESRHNLKYWKCEEYIGIAPSAHSYFNGKRYSVPKNLEDFIKNDFQTEIITDEICGDFTEKAMLLLRLKSGLPLDMCNSTVIKKSENLIKNGLAEIINNSICLTPNGFLMSNQIIEYLIF